MSSIRNADEEQPIFYDEIKKEKHGRIPGRNFKETEDFF